MVTEEDVRRVALSLPGSIERSYNRLPSFRVRNNLFLRIHELPDAFFVRCASVEERNELLRAQPGKFFITPHYDGYPGLLVRPSQVGLDEMTEIVTESWRLSAPKRLLATYDTGHPTGTVTGLHQYGSIDERTNWPGKPGALLHPAPFRVHVSMHPAQAMPSGRCFPMAFGIYTRRTGRAVHGLAWCCNQPARSDRACGVSTPSPSTPAVRRPALSSVTRRTLTSVFDRDRSISFCRLRTA